MKKMTLQKFINNNESLHELVPPDVVGFAKGWARSWVEYSLPTFPAGNVDVDEFHHYNDWELNLVLNPEALRVEVYAYPYIDEEEQADFSHFVRIAEVPLNFTTDNNKSKER